MDRFSRFIRIATAFAVALIFAVASTTVGPSALKGQDSGDPCVEEWEEEVGPCVDLQHRDPWWETCEGSACWTTWEVCCLPEIVVR